MAKQGTILVVDDNKAVLNALEMLLAGVFREYRERGTLLVVKD